MDIIEYTNKTINNLNENGIEAKVISYEVSEEDLMKIAYGQEDSIEEYKPRAFFLKDKNKENILELV